ncbi:unnamed protein product [[Candida] boidinii]|nr:unnamed protein product [[Candida] boidinii]
MPEIKYLVEDNEDDNFTTGEFETGSTSSFQENESESDGEAIGIDDELSNISESQDSLGKLNNRLNFTDSRRQLTNFNNKDQIIKSSRISQSSLTPSNNQSLSKQEIDSEKRLSIILQNPNSNSVVIQDKSTKKFELVRLRLKNNNNNSNNSNCNQLSRRNNSIYDGNNDTTESFDTNGVSNSSTNFTNPYETDIVCPHCGFIIPLSTTSTSNSNNHADSGIPLNSDSADPHTHNRRSSSMDSSEYDRYTSYDNNNKNWYIHNDYFKLLANTEYPNIQNQEIISKYLTPLLRGRRNQHQHPQQQQQQEQQQQQQQQVSNSLNTFLSQKKRKVSNGELPISLKLLPPQDTISNRDFQYGNNNDNNSEIDEINDSLPDTLFTQGYYEKFFRTIKILGNGSNGKVFKVEHVLHDLPLGIFALKKIAIGNHLSNLETILKEVTLLYKLTESTDLLNVNSFNENDTKKKGVNERGEGNGENDEEEEDIEEIKDGIKNLIKYNHVWLEIDNLSSFGPKVPCVFILFEYCDGGTLDELVESLIQPKFDINKEKEWRRLIRNQKKGDNGINEINLRKQLFLKSRFLNNFEIYKIFKDIVKGVLFLHKSRILHRDLKPSNCLLKQKFNDEIKIEPVNSIYDLYKLPNIVVSDFGEGAMEGMKRNSTGATGTIEFCAPELFFTQDGNSYDNIIIMRILYFILMNFLQDQMFIH